MFVWAFLKPCDTRSSQRQPHIHKLFIFVCKSTSLYAIWDTMFCLGTKQITCLIRSCLSMPSDTRWLWSWTDGEAPWGLSVSTQRYYIHTFVQIGHVFPPTQTHTGSVSCSIFNQISVVVWAVLSEREVRQRYCMRCEGNVCWCCKNKMKSVSVLVRSWNCCDTAHGCS